MRAMRFVVDVEADDPIRVTPPRTVDSRTFPGEQIEIPWAIHIDDRVELSFLAKESLVELRDAITAALDARGEQS